MKNPRMWQIWIDTGGTFTDAIAIDPGGKRHTAKVLSSSALRGRITGSAGTAQYRIEGDWQAADGFVTGFTFRPLSGSGFSAIVTAHDVAASLITLDRPLPEELPGRSGAFEVISPEESPILAARLLTATPPGRILPPVRMRLSTTRGTNALLEQKGAPVLLLVTRGFGDLPLIGDQKRPDLFSLAVEKPEPVQARVLEVSGRIAADGTVLEELDGNGKSGLPKSVREEITSFLKQEQASVAIALLNSYRNPVHERQLEAIVRELGAESVSVSSALGAKIRYLPRIQTTSVNATLEPILRNYLEGVRKALEQSRLHIMTSAGGLSPADAFHPKDSLLSGPAGGVVGAATAGRAAGYEMVISFDMGGTSTDVARYDGGYDYLFEHRVGDATLNAPALAIETVAAGGGSICSFDGHTLRVGPESGGAWPGPACYGAGGPLTVTDVNLLLGRLQPENFSIPISPGDSRRRLEEIMKAMREAGEEPVAAEILEGFLQIANERMADAVRRISLRKGYDPAEYVLVAFGGAGGQHAAAIAAQLRISTILIPAETGLLSASGLGNAVVEQFAERQVLQPLEKMEDELPEVIHAMEREAKEKISADEAPPEQIGIRRRLLFMRLLGQDSTLEIEYTSPAAAAEQFMEAYRRQFGHRVEGREIEVESIRVVASEIPPPAGRKEAVTVEDTPEPFDRREIRFAGAGLPAPVYRRHSLRAGHRLAGPALVLDPYSTVVLEPGWSAEILPGGTLRMNRKEAAGNGKQTYSRAAELELFTNRFTSIAGEMGEMLRRTALSVNIRERRDFSCALLNARGELIVNAPHIPVHLGALGLCVRRLQQEVDMQPGDVVVTNHPAFGGSHLPDITVVTPVFAGPDRLIGYAASRAHHAEIGGTRPGSMPPDATTLAEEGVVISPFRLVRQGRAQWDRMRGLLEDAPLPSRAPEENIADLQAAVAANHRGATSLLEMVEAAGADRVLFHMEALRDRAAEKVREALRRLPEMDRQAEERLDDGTPLRVRVRKKGDTLKLDFTGTGPVHPGNLNATPAIVQSVVIYVIRLLVEEDLPLNEGLLEPVTLILPECLLNPPFGESPEDCPAVVGGNTEISQRLTDLLLKPFGRVACSQGTMNNVLFGNDHFGYYETVGGGTGAGPGFDGADGVHHHMTNTAGTDPETLEHRYPVRLRRYALRKGSGGSGKQRGGDGIIRELEFLQPVRLSVLTQHRVQPPYGLQGGEPGKCGEQWVITRDGRRHPLAPVDGFDMEEGDIFILHTPGGGGFGS